MKKWKRGAHRILAFVLAMTMILSSFQGTGMTVQASATDEALTVEAETSTMENTEDTSGKGETTGTEESVTEDSEATPTPAPEVTEEVTPTPTPTPVVTEEVTPTPTPETTEENTGETAPEEDVADVVITDEVEAPVYYAGLTNKLTDTNIGLSSTNDSYATWNGSATTITGVIKGNGVSREESTLTITNNSGKEATLYFTYSKSVYDGTLFNGEAKINGSTTAEGDLSYSLVAGGTVTVYIKSGRGSSATTSVTLSGIRLEVKVDNPVINYLAPVNGSYTVDSTTISADTEMSKPVDTSSYTVSATASSGYVFIGWMANDLLVSNEASTTLTFTADAEVYPLFAASNEAVYMLLAKKTVHTELGSAIDEAEDEGDTIVLLNSGTVSAGTYTIPSNVTFLMPYTNGAYTVNDSGDDHPYINASYIAGTTALSLPSDSKTYLSLNIPDKTSIVIANGGKLILGGEIGACSGGAADGRAGQTAGNHSDIVLGAGASITVNEGGVLSAAGYIIGSESSYIDIKGDVYEPFVIIDYCGGTASQKMYSKGITPFNRYTMQNIQVKKHVYSTASGGLHGYCDLYADDKHNKTTPGIIARSNALINLSNGEATITPDRNRYVKDRAEFVYGTDLVIDGDAVFNKLSISVTLLGFSIPISTDDVLFPVPYNYNITIKSGTFSMGNKIKILPGATVTVEEGATLNLSGTTIVYDGFETVPFEGNTGAVSGYPSKTLLTDAELSERGRLIVNGTLNLTSGSFGGLVETTNNTGIVNVGSITKSVTSSEGHSDCKNLTVRTLVAQLTNGSENVFDLSTSKTYYGTYYSGEESVQNTYNCTSVGASASADVEYGAPVTVTGRWVTGYTVTLKNDGETVAGTGVELYTPGSEVKPSFSVTPPTGYKLKEWSGYSPVNAITSGDGTAVLISSMPRQDLTLTAVWEPEQYDISYSLNDGVLKDGESNPSSYTIESSKITLNNPEKDGYTFAGWTGSNGTVAQTTVEIATGSTGNKNYTANWTAVPYNIAYVVDGVSTTYDDVYHTYTIESELKLPTPTKTGYAFAGWKVNNTSEVITEIETGRMGELNLIATWTPNENTPYAIEYYCMDFNGEYAATKSGILEVTGTTDTTVVLTAEIMADLLTLTGFTFDVDNSSAVLAGQIAADGSLVLKVYYERDKYTLAFESNGGSTVESITNYYNKPITVPNDPTKTGHTFTGWYTSATCDEGTKVTLPTSMPAGSKTYYAGWSINEYTITFNSMGGSSVDSITANFNEGILAPENPSRDGYEFTGWYLTSACEEGAEVILPTSMPAENKTYYAGWKAKTYTVTLNLNGGSLEDGVENTVSVIYNGAYESVLSIKPTKIGHTFDGWYLDEDCTVKISEDTKATTAKDHNLYADWSKNTFSIVFYKNGGELESGSVDASSRTYKYGEGTLPTLIDLGYYRLYYNFAGWTTSADSTVVEYANEYSFVDNPLVVENGETIELYAVWTPIKYDITYSGEGIDSVTNPTTYNVTDTVILNNPTRTGYKFLGWTGSNGTTPQTTVTIAEGSNGVKSYIANWEALDYAIEYIVDDEEVTFTGKETYTIETELDLPVPTKTGHTFAGWQVGTTSNVITKIEKGNTGNLTLTATWTAAKYTVTFDANYAGAENAGTTEVTYGETYGTLPTVSRTGYAFDGWFTAETDGERITADDTVSIEEDTTLYAWWTPNTYSVTLNLDGGSLSSGVSNVISVTFDDTYVSKLPADPTKTGYSFGGWYFDSACSEGQEVKTGELDASVVTKAENHILYAKWIPNTDTDYTIEYYFMQLDGTYADAATGKVVAEGTTATQVAVTADTLVGKVDLTGFTFDTTKKTDLTGEIVADGSLVLKAYYTRNQYKFTVVIDTDVSTDTLYYYETAVQSPTAPTKTGHTFGGWDKTVPSTMPAEDVVITAQWTVNQYMITFDSAGGTQIDEVKYDYAAAIVAPTDPEKDGYTFKGWSPTVPVTMPAENITLTAQWEANTYSVTLDTNGGALDEGTANTKDVVFDDAYGELPEPSRDGYTFDGWYISDGTAVTPTTDVKTAGNHTLTAHWTAKKYNVELILNDGYFTGETLSSIEVSFDAVYPTIKEPLKVGYTFEGWYLDSALKQKVEFTGDSATKVTTSGDHQLYANWTANTYSVTLNTVGGELPTGVSETVIVTFAGTYPDDLPEPTKTGYTFDGWYLNAGYEGNAVTGSTAVATASHHQLFAKWNPNTYYVHFEGNGHTNNVTMEAQEFTYDVQQALVANIYEKEGYTFTGWATSETGSVVYTDKLPVSNLVTEGTYTLYAVWAAGTNTKYTVNHYLQNIDNDQYTLASEFGNPQTLYGVTDGETKAVAKSYDGFTVQPFEQEAIAADGSTVVDIYYNRNLHDVAWTLTDDSTIVVEDVRYGAAITVPTDYSNPDRTGYTFEKWAYADGTTYDVLNAVMPDADVSINAQWSINSYKLTWIIEGEENHVETKDFGSLISGYAPEKTGYTLSDWYTESKYTQVAEIPDTMPANDCTYYAKWNANSYSLTFDANEGTCETASMSVTYGRLYGDLPTAARDGYSFAGWYTAKTGGTQIKTADTVAITSDTTLFAHWTANTYTVTFDANTGAGTVEDVTHTYGSEENTLPTANDLSKVGYSFVEWNTSADGEGTSYEAGSTVDSMTSEDNAEIQLYAIWRVHTYTVRFDGNGNTNDVSMADQTFTYDVEDALTENVFVKDGYHFVGWTTQKDDSTESVEAASVSALAEEMESIEYTDKESVSKLSADDNAVITLYAVWEINTYTVIFKPDTAEGTTTWQNYTDGVSQELNDNPFNKIGYTFVNWSGDDGNTYTDGQELMLHNLTHGATITLTAVWTPNTNTKYTVHYHLPQLDGTTVVETKVYEDGTSDATKEAPQIEVEGFTAPEIKKITVTADGEASIDYTYTRNNYVVTWNVDGTKTTDTIAYEDIISLPTTPEKAGYTFVNWTDETGNVLTATTKMPASDVVYTANWRENEYTVSFNGNGNTNDATMTDQTFTNGVAQALSANVFDRTGYSFEGWSASNGEIYSDMQQITLADMDQGTVITLTAIWKANEKTPYKVEHYQKGIGAVAEYVLVDTEELFGTTDSSVIPDTKDYPGFTAPEKQTVTIKADGSLVVEYYYIRNQYTVTWISGNGDDTTTTTRYYEQEIRIIDVPVHSGYTFDGWYSDAEFKNEAVIDIMPANDVTYYGKWSIDTYNIRYIMNDGTWPEGTTVIDSYTVESDLITLPRPVKPGYTFTGWSGSNGPDPEMTVQIIAGSTGEKSYTANFEANTYQVVFDGNGHTNEVIMAAQDFVYDEDAKALSISQFEKTGHTFLGWSLNKGAEVADYTDGQAVSNLAESGSVTLYAIWQINQYTITFDVNGGSPEIDSITANYGTVITAPVNPSKPGYTFDGWDVAIPTTMPDENLDLTAQWSPTTYTVNFDPNDGTGEMTSIDMIYDGDRVSLPENKFTRTGYTFVGWSKNADEDGTGTIYSDKAAVRNLTVEESVTLYAYWQVNKYTLTFDGNGGTTSVASIYAAYGSDIEVPSDPTRMGYTFDGWSPEIPETVPAENVTYAAQWTPVKYTVKFDSNGGTGTMEAISLTYDESKVLPVNMFLKEGHAFDGWLYGEEVFSDGATVGNLAEINGETVTLTAKWRILPYIMTFVLNNGQADIVRNQNYGTTITVPEDPDYAGYRFDYWVDEDGELAVIPSTMPAYASTYTAHWTSYLELLYAIPVTSFENAETDPAHEEVLNDAREYYAELNPDQIALYTSTAKDSKYVQHYEMFAKTVEAVSVRDLKAAVVSAEDVTNDTLYTDTYKQIATIDVDGENMHVNTMFIRPDCPAAEMLNINFLVELFGYPEIKGVVIDSSACEGDSFTQFNIMLAIAFETIGRELGYTDIDSFSKYLRENREILIDELDGHSISATVKATTPEGINYSVDYTMDFFNQYHDVIWQQNNGEADVVNPTAFETEIKLPAEPVRVGHSFTGWVDANNNSFVPGTLMGKTDVTYTATWSVNEYTISFDTDGGTEIAPVTKNYGEGVDAPKAPEKEGYTFAGWYSDPECTVTADIPSTMPASDKTYYAGWTVNQYTISFDAKGGTDVDSITANYGSEVSEPTVPTKTGYTFADWTTEAGAVVTWPVTVPAANVKYLATWTADTYNATLDPAGGTLENTVVTITYGEQYNLPTPTRAGYTFDGWYADDGTKVNSTDVVNVTSDISLTAKWQVGESYGITYDLAEGKWADGTEVRNNYNVTTETFTLLTPVREGHTFLGWTGSNGEAPELTVTVEKGTTGNLSYTANWQINQYTITFDTDGGSTIGAITAEYGTAVTVPDAPTRTGYSFVSWDKIIPTTMPAENITITAQWKINQYQISFVTNGGTPVTAITGDYESAITAPDDPTKTGYTFSGWYSDAECKNKVELPSKMPAADTIYYAGWAVNEYSITFDSNGGSKVTTQYFDYGAAIELPAAPVKEGYSFVAWETEDGSAIPTTMPANNIALTAKWTINSYNLIYIVDGKTTDTIPVTYGAGIVLKEGPTKEGYTFSGWSEVPATMPAEEVTVTGTFTANQYTLTYDVNYPAAPTIDSKTVTYDGTYGTLPVPVRTGYKFTGWTLDNLAITAETIVRTAKNHTLTANWTANTYRVNLDANGGICAKEYIEVVYDGTYAELPAPVLEGYEFVGWFDGDVQVMNTANVTITATQNLVARWNEAGDTPYKVEHYQETVAGTYELVITEELKGATNAEIQATQKSYTGFYVNTEESTVSGKITADGSLVLKIYYDRETYGIVWKVANKEIRETYKYGETLRVPDTTWEEDIHAGYTFIAWNTNIPQVAARAATYEAQYEVYYEAVIGDVTYRTLKLGLENAGSGQTVTLVRDVTLTENISVPSGVLLLLPCMDGDTGYTLRNNGNLKFNYDGTNAAGSEGPGPEAKLYRALTVPEGINMTVDGTVLVNSVSGRPSAGHKDQDITGGYAQINLEGNIIVSGALDCFGYVKGSGQITANPGSEVADMYLVRNWRGGTQGYAMYEANVYPMNEYDCHNIETDIRIENGASYVGLVKMYAGSQYNYTRFPQVDNKNGLIRLNEGGYLIRSYDGERETFTIYGGADFAKSSLKIVGVDLTTAEFIYPIDGDITYNLNGGRYDFVNDYKFLTGAVVNVAGDASLNVAEGTTVVFYQEFEDVANSDNTEYPDRPAAELNIAQGASFTNAGTFAGHIYTESADILIGADPVWTAQTREANGYVSQVAQGEKTWVAIDHELSISRPGHTWSYGFNDSIVWDGEADYALVYQAIAQIPEDLDYYTPESTVYIQPALDKVEYHLPVAQQAKVDAMADPIIEAIDKLVLRKITIHFDLNGGTMTASTQKKVDTIGTYGTLPRPTKAYSTFAGWYDADGVRIRDNAELISKTDITLTARWQMDDADYAGVRAARKQIPSDMSMYSDESVAEVNAAVNEVDWNLTLDRQAEVDAMAQRILDAIAALEYYQVTVNLNADGGTVNPTSMTVDYTQPIGTLPTPKKEGHGFLGWYNASGTKITSSTIVNSKEPMNLTARWVEGEFYTVTYELAGGQWKDGTVVVDQYQPTTEDFKIPVPVRTGYTFLGWTGTDIEEPQKSVVIEKGSAGNLEFTANWKINKYTITFDSAGGSEVKAITLPYGSKVTAPNNPTRTGASFQGWDKEIPATMPAKNMTITANWIVYWEIIVNRNTDESISDIEVIVYKPAPKNLTLSIGDELAVTKDVANAAPIHVTLPDGYTLRLNIAMETQHYGNVVMEKQSSGDYAIRKDTKLMDDGVAIMLSKSQEICVVENSRSFPDIAEEFWAENEIDYMTSREFILGNTDGTYGPTDTIQRRTVAILLYRLEGEPAVNERPIFPDVAVGSYYSKAITWAYDNGIITGYTNGNFGPTDTLTRQHLAAMLYRYNNYKQFDMERDASKDIATFNDYADIRAWARESCQWAYQVGVVNGRAGNMYDPNGSASRAQLSVILSRYLQLYYDETVY